MSAIALVTLPFTIASTVIQEVNRAEQTKQQKKAAEAAAKSQEEQKQLAQRQLDLAAQQEADALKSRQQAASDSLRAYYYKNGINPNQGSAQVALQSLAKKTSQDLSLLEQDVRLKKQILDSKGHGGGYIANYNPLDGFLNVANNFQDAFRNLKENQDSRTLS